MAYLHTVAQRGADTHTLLVSQHAPVDRARCTAAYGKLTGNDIPHDIGAGMGIKGSASDQWKSQVKEFFVDSCVSGEPQPLPSRLATAPPDPFEGSGR